MKNWKTTLSGLLTCIGLAITTSDNPNLHLVGIISAALGALLTGASAKDHNVTGGTTAQ
jgi:hypothetical protein